MLGLSYVSGAVVFGRDHLAAGPFSAMVRGMYSKKEAGREVDDGVDDEKGSRPDAVS